MEQVKIAAVGPFWGYGIHRTNKEGIEQALKWRPDIVVGQGTTADIGPHYIAEDFPENTRTCFKREYEIFLPLIEEYDIPCILSAGTGGSNMQLDAHLRIMSEVAKEMGFKMRIAAIGGELDKQYVKSKLMRREEMRRAVETPRIPRHLSLEDIQRSEKIVSQMGAEPIMKALDLDVDVIVTGRALDTALFAAFPLKMVFYKGLAYHMGRLVEIAGAI